MADYGPLKLMYLNPVGTPDYDAVFADIARAVKLPGLGLPERVDP